MTDCELGCGPHGSIGECPRDCPCECHRAYPGLPVLASGDGRMPASLPRPGEVIPRPYDDLALEKVAPEHQRTILDSMKPEPMLGLHDPFDDPDLPDELRRKHP